MAWNKYDKVPLQGKDTIKFYSSCVVAGVVLAIAYVLFPFLYSDNYLFTKSAKDAQKIEQINDSSILDKKLEIYTTDFSVIDIRKLDESCYYVIVVSKYSKEVGFKFEKCLGEEE